MTDTMATEHSRRQMIRVARLTAMRTKQKGVEAALLTPYVERCDVSKELIYPVTVRRILGCVPIFGKRKFPVESALSLAFVVYTVEANNSL